MKKYQLSSADEIKEKLEQHNYWRRMHSNKLLSKVQVESPSKIIKDGTSRIVSYYDEHIKYLCTIHQIVTKDGKVIHEHVKDAYLGGIRYKAKEQD